MNQIKEFLIIIALFFPTFGAIRLLFISQPEIDRIIVGIVFTYTFILILSSTILCGVFVMKAGSFSLVFEYSGYMLISLEKIIFISVSFNINYVFLFLINLTLLVGCLVKKVHLDRGRLNFSALEIELIFLNFYTIIIFNFLIILILIFYLCIKTNIISEIFLWFLGNTLLSDLTQFFGFLKVQVITSSFDIFLYTNNKKSMNIVRIVGIDFIVSLYFILTFLLIIVDVEKNKKFNLDDFLFFSFFIYFLIYCLL